MLDASHWLEKFRSALHETFGGRVWFFGLQGSYGRGEATAGSDIDLVVILDEVTARDIRAYDAMLDTLPHRELACGFFAGRAELFAWEPSDLFQLYYDTTPIEGSLDGLLPLFTEETVDRAIRIGVCNIYHGCVHNMLYEKSEELLRGSYKSASFVMQAIVFRKTGRYLRTLRELCPLLSPDDRQIIETFLSLKQEGAVALDEMSRLLLAWVTRYL
jgi:predicted nucleotidyltransferase